MVEHRTTDPRVRGSIPLFFKKAPEASKMTRLKETAGLVRGLNTPALDTDEKACTQPDTV